MLTGLLACSNHQVAGGNSAESGNPELTGRVLANGAPAAYTRLQCVPTGFNALHDSLMPQQRAIADTAGNYSFDSLPKGECSLEAYQASSGLRILVQKINIVKGKVDTVNPTLRAPGTVRIGMTGLQNGDSVWVYVPGTSIVKRVAVKFSAIFIDSLPTDSVSTDSLHFKVSMMVLGDSITKDFTAKVVAGNTVSVNAPPPISLSFHLALNTSANSANLKDTLYAFPLCLHLDSTRIDFSVIAPNAGRIRVFKSDSSTEIPSHISNWNASEHNAQLWVRLDTLLPQSASQNLIVTYQEGDTSHAKFVHQPFDSADGFIGVWHFDEGTTQASDATPNGLNGVASNVASVPGVVGKGFQFDGRSSYVDITNSASGPLNFNYIDTMSLSVWVNLKNPNTSRPVLDKGPYQYYLTYYYPHGWLFNNEEQSTASYRHWYQFGFDTTTDKGNWMLLTVLHVGTQVSLYRNDTLMDTSSSFAIDVVTNRDTTSDLLFGKETIPSTTSDSYFFEGILDEVQISGVHRSQSWIHMMYLNQKPTGYWPR